MLKNFYFAQKLGEEHESLKDSEIWLAGEKETERETERQRDRDSTET